jgi:hypothetical protein
MKYAILLLASICGAASTDSLAVRRFRADTAIAGQLWRQAAHQDSAAYQGRIQAQTIYQLAVQHLSQDTARKAP